MFRTALITSGPTLEPIDPVRFISNRSSGKTGYFLAQEGVSRAMRVFFVSGPTAYLPRDVELVQVETALEMREAVLARAAEAEVVIMAAAVCDFRSAKYYPEKIKKERAKLHLDLVRNPDILGELGERKREKQILVGFAAETENIFENAMKKLRAKNLDLLVLNEISDSNPAFDADDNQVYLVTPDHIQKLERLPKARIARHVWDEIDVIACRSAE